MPCHCDASLVPPLDTSVVGSVCCCLHLSPHLPSPPPPPLPLLCSRPIRWSYPVHCRLAPTPPTPPPIPPGPSATLRGLVRPQVLSFLYTSLRRSVPSPVQSVTSPKAPPRPTPRHASRCPLDRRQERRTAWASAVPAEWLAGWLVVRVHGRVRCPYMTASAAAGVRVQHLGRGGSVRACVCAWSRAGQRARVTRRGRRRRRAPGHDPQRLPHQTPTNASPASSPGGGRQGDNDTAQAPTVRVGCCATLSKLCYCRYTLHYSTYVTIE